MVVWCWCVSPKSRAKLRIPDISRNDTDHRTSLNRACGNFVRLVKPPRRTGLSALSGNFSGSLPTTFQHRKAFGYAIGHKEQRQPAAQMHSSGELGIASSKTIDRCVKCARQPASNVGKGDEGGFDAPCAAFARGNFASRGHKIRWVRERKAATRTAQRTTEKSVSQQRCCRYQ